MAICFKSIPIRRFRVVAKRFNKQWWSHLVECVVSQLDRPRFCRSTVVHPSLKDVEDN